ITLTGIFNAGVRSPTQGFCGWQRSARSLQIVNAPIVIGKADILVNAKVDFPGCTLTGQKTERVEFKFTDIKVSGCRYRFWRFGPESEHAPRHVLGGGDQQVTFPTLFAKDFSDFNSTFKGVA